jgi:membrane-associated protease RseP (regulator of RpoE activity)
VEEPSSRSLIPVTRPDTEPYYVFRPPPVRNRVWLHVLLFLLTVFTTTWVGGQHYRGFTFGFGGAGRTLQPVVLTGLAYYASGLWYSVTILAILGCHEMGHYLACRWYRVGATLPFFLPAPLPLTGTLGAFIRIRSRIPSKRALFDIAFAGPIAGFLVAVPALFLGLSMSVTERVPQNVPLYELGEPLLFRAASWLIFGNLENGISINMHPVAFAAWFGLLATALNLFPISQLDGGHISHAVLGRRSTFVTLVMIACAVGLTYLSMSWLVWTVLMLVMLAAMGPQHPPTLDEDTPLDSTRVFLAVVALIMLIVCFSPVPIEPFVTGQGGR